MCYAPVRIKNPRLEFDTQSDKLFLTVPCGKCGQCRSAKQKEFELRCYHEYIETIQKNGYVLFQTFTYSQDKVPSTNGFLHFDSHHYKWFMEKMRKRLRDAGYDVVGNLKVFWTSEYGGETHRPHYHALFFVTFDIDPEVFDRFTVEAWSDHDNVPYGRTDLEHPYHKRLVNAQGAIAYVAKYVTKDIDFDEVFQNQKGKDGVKFSAKIAVVKEMIKRKYEYELNRGVSDLVDPYPNQSLGDLFKLLDLQTDFINKIQPFHRQSKGLGLSMIEHLSMDELMSGRTTLPDNDPFIVKKDVNIPLYIDRHVFYNVDPKTRCFTLNDLGKMMKVKRFRHNAGYVKESIRLWYNSLQDGSFCRKPVLDLLRPQYELLGNTIKKKQFSTSLKPLADFLLSGRSIDDFVSYVCVYHDRCMLASMRKVDLPVLTHYAFDVYVDSLIMQGQSTSVVHVPLMSTSDFDVLFRNTYNFHSSLVGFPELLELYNACNYVLCCEQQRQYIFEYKLKQKLRKFNPDSI